ncbi:polysaccharide deacetylase family protein [Sphingomonas paeninsulae]|uniref:polysaccharide deacetylase family protein n=1 Tax=Sphingomonas paeninsulae TaxID=2319844 RepID=UPI001EF0DC7D|nr:polysaccharide deacetylase family protein [Sphingomonas paeninsulae]
MLIVRFTTKVIVIGRGKIQVECARLDLPPPVTARIILPTGFGRRFAIFADAEEEFDWNAPFSRDSVATSAMSALPEANVRLVAAGCVPTHMVDWPIVDTPATATIIRTLVENDQCDVGTQLHPWVNPPFDEDLSGRNSYLGNLPIDLQRAKLFALTERIERAFGVRPTIYRAGRYGIGRHTADLLVEAGYRLDVSIRSLFDYRRQGGPDFSGHPVWPWRVSDTLNELPLTAAFTGRLRRYPSIYNGKIGGLLARTGMIGRVPLTPEGVPLTDACEAIRCLLDDGHQLFSLSFHTPSVVPGHTPYVRDAADLRTFWSWWDGVFDLFAKNGVLPIRSTEIMHALETA